MFFLQWFIWSFHMDSTSQIFVIVVTCTLCVAPSIPTFKNFFRLFSRNPVERGRSQDLSLRLSKAICWWTGRQTLERWLQSSCHAWWQISGDGKWCQILGWGNLEEWGIGWKSLRNRMDLNLFPSLSMYISWDVKSILYKSGSSGFWKTFLGSGIPQKTITC